MDTFFAHKDAYMVLFTVIVGLAVSGPFLVYYWFKGRRAEMEIELKRELAQRGMSAAEICAVIEAGNKGDDALGLEPDCKRA